MPQHDAIGESRRVEKKCKHKSKRKPSGDRVEAIGTALVNKVARQRRRTVLYRNKLLLKNPLALAMGSVKQYVGAKDVNDKEIYEGDIVKMHYFAEGYDPQTLSAFETDIEVVGVVKMDVFGAVTRTTDGKEYIWANLLEDVGEEIEVLGNIYENPDLIEQEDEG